MVKIGLHGAVEERKGKGAGADRALHTVGVEQIHRGWEGKRKGLIEGGRVTGRLKRNTGREP